MKILKESKIKTSNILLESLINEDFKSMKIRYLEQGVESSIIDNYINTFKSIKDLKELNDDIQSFPIQKGNDRKNIDNYKDFRTLQTIVDYVKGKRDIKTTSVDNKKDSSNDETLSFPGNVVVKNNDVEIKYADSPRACIEYKGKFPYSWCISRSDASNMFSTYRFKENEPAFYFVKRIKATEKEFGIWNMTKNIFNGDFKDKYHFFVLQVVKNANPNNQEQKQYIVTSAENDGDIEMSWNDILKFAPELDGLQSKFIAVPLTPNEKATFDKYIEGISDEEFSKLDYKEKRNYLDIYVKMDKHLSDNQFDSLPDDLKGLYIGFGIPISKYIFDFVMSNGKLRKRYDEILKRRFDEFLNGRSGIKFGGDEIMYGFKNNMVDISKLGSIMIDRLLTNTPREQRYDLVLQILPLVKDKLDKDIISTILYRIPEKQKYEIVKQILPLVEDKLDSHIIELLLRYTLEAQRYGLALQIFPLVKDKLDGDIISSLLSYTPSEQRYDLVKQIFPLVKNRIDGNIINSLLSNTPEKQKYDLVKQIFPLVKDKIDSDIIYYLLGNTPKEQRYNINKENPGLINQIFPLVKDKLDGDIIEVLLDYTPYEHKQEVQTLIDKYQQKDVVNELRLIVRNILKENYLI